MADKFAARQSGKYIVVSLLPDVCITPNEKGSPVPFTISIDLSGAAQCAKQTFFNSDAAFLYDQSDTVEVKGDEPGQGKGVKSGTVGAKAEPIGHSPSVRIEKKQLVREDDLFYMNEKNTIGKLATSESGSEAHIQDNGDITGETKPPGLLDQLKEKPEKSAEWIEQQKQDFTDSFKDTLKEEFKDVIEEAEEIAGGPVDYTGDMAESALEYGKNALVEAEEIIEINAERYGQLAEQFGDDPAGAVGELFGDLKDEAVILKDEVGDTLTEMGGDITDWSGELGDFGKAGGILAGTAVSAGADVVSPSKKGKAAKEVAEALGEAAKRAAALKKRKLKKRKETEGGGNDKNDGGKSKGDGEKCGKANINKGDCAERLVERKYKAKGYHAFEAGKLQNNSGHGLDHVFHGNGEILVVETKSNQSRLSRLQKKGGDEYLDHQHTAMTRGFEDGEGRWKKYKDNEAFGDALDDLNDILESNDKKEFKVCKAKLQDDPSGCYGKGGKGKCKLKAGTTINCKPW